MGVGGMVVAGGYPFFGRRGGRSVHEVSGWITTRNFSLFLLVMRCFHGGDVTGRKAVSLNYKKAPNFP